MNPAVPADLATAPTPANLRRDYRHRIRNLAYVTLGPDNGGILRDVSEAGVAIQSVRPLTLDENVPVRFELLRPRARVEGTGRVVWTDSAGQAGVQFTEITARSRRQLKDWLFTQVLQSGHAPPDSIFSEQSNETAPAAVPEEVVTEATESMLNDTVLDVPWWPFAMTSGRLRKLIDGLAVSSAVLLFCVVALSMTNVFPAWPIAILLAAALTAMFAGVYWILFMLCMGATPGSVLAGCLACDRSGTDEDDRPRFR